MKRFFSLFIFLIIIWGCTQKELENPSLMISETDYISETEGFVSATKTSLTSSNEVVWSKSDKVIIFQGSTEGDIFQVSDVSAGTSKGIFSQIDDVDEDTTEGDKFSKKVAVYPYLDEIAIDEIIKNENDEVEGFVLSGICIQSVQQYAKDTFGNGAFPMVAVTEDLSDYNLNFKNVCGVLKLKVKGTGMLKSITVEGNDDESLAGTSSVKVLSKDLKPVIEKIEDADKSVTLDCGEGTQLNPENETNFLIALRPVGFKHGFKVSFTFSDGRTRIIETSKENPIRRSAVLAMPVINLDEIVTEDDYVDEYGINHGTGMEIDGVVWAPVNCGFRAPETDESGNVVRAGYPYGKLYQWGRKYGQGYSDDNYSDEEVAEVMEWSVDYWQLFQDEYFSVYFKLGIIDNNYDWAENRQGIDVGRNDMWRKQKEDRYLKTCFDPCPEGWRVPTYEEMSSLIAHRSSSLQYFGTSGYMFCGKDDYSEDAPSVFLPSAGYRNENGQCGGREAEGYYWTSSATSDGLSSSVKFDAGQSGCHTSYRSCGYSVRCVRNDEEEIFVHLMDILFDNYTVKLAEGDIKPLNVRFNPENATVDALTWRSEDETIATVTSEGCVIGVSAGTAGIVAECEGISSRCVVRVLPQIEKIDYVDEFQVNHGKGVKIDGVIWAPVNCGFHASYYPYGKLYQWGRKYGQGCSLDYDRDVPEIAVGPVSHHEGQAEGNADVFFETETKYNSYNWLLTANYHLWNKGTEKSPVRTDFDPCPDGWRVPTNEELAHLVKHYSSWTKYNGQNGYWFSGMSDYTYSSPSVFLPAAGYRDYYGNEYVRGSYGLYYSSSMSYGGAYMLWQSSSNAHMKSGWNCGYGCSVRCVQDAGFTQTCSIPAESVSLNKEEVVLMIGGSVVLQPTVYPADATYDYLVWESEDESIAVVDQSGKVTAVSSGITGIKVSAGDASVKCLVMVASVNGSIEYIDENDVNHGRGTNIDGVVWAPVNCGYEKPTDDNKGYSYGKLYQWGRRFGQGYSLEYDSEEPQIVAGPVSVAVADNDDNSNVFYTATSENSYNWLTYFNSNLWNSGTESNPEKTAYDPCPKGWRVPTYAELLSLSAHYSKKMEHEGQTGYWFTGSVIYSSSITNKVFLPIGGDISYDGSKGTFGVSSSYWCSGTHSPTRSYALAVRWSVQLMNWERLASGYYVRCVQE